MDPRKLISLIFVLVGFNGRAQFPPPLLKAIQASRAQEDLTYIGLHFLGKPYTRNSLSTGNSETLVADLSSFDCVTFIENSLALAHSNGNDAAYRSALRHSKLAVAVW
jgi:hypothetical protein